MDVGASFLKVARGELSVPRRAAAAPAAVPKPRTAAPVSASHRLAQSKSIPPRLRENFVPHSRQLGALCTAINSHMLTRIFAPAGCGTTTLPTSPVTVLSDVCVAWIFLDEDNDPARVLTGEGELHA